MEPALVAGHSAALSSSTSLVTHHTEIVNLRTITLLHRLRHTGVPLARPGLLLVALSALLLTTLGYMCIMLADGAREASQACVLSEGFRDVCP